jgi:4-amino-4-deoxy-L-arabinose transferase-like glycosyltransferase
VGETALGICLTAALTAWWGIPALQQTGGEYFRVGMGVHVFQRSTAVNDGHGLKGWAGYILTAPLYFLTFLVSFLPWTIRRPEGELPELRALRQHGRGGAAAAWVLQRVSFILTIPIRIWRWWPTRKSDDLGWYLLGQALIVFGAFSLVRTKLPHYTMPAFPCIALWLALQLRGEAGAAAWFQKRLATMVVLVLILMLGGGAVVRHEFLTERLWVALKPYTQAETRIGFYGFNESSLVWKFRGVVTNTVTLGEEKNAKNFLTNAPPFILVLPTKDLPALGDISGLRIPVHGFDMVKIRNWDLTAIVRQQPGQ